MIEKFEGKDFKKLPCYLKLVCQVTLFPTTHDVLFIKTIRVLFRKSINP